MHAMPIIPCRMVKIGLIVHGKPMRPHHPPRLCSQPSHSSVLRAHQKAASLASPCSAKRSHAAHRARRVSVGVPRGPKRSPQLVVSVTVSIGAGQPYGAGELAHEAAQVPLTSKLSSP